MVEVASPSDSHRELNDEAQMWLRHGGRLVRVVQPDARTVDVHTADGSVSILGDDEPRDGGDMLPGFNCAVCAIFDA